MIPSIVGIDTFPSDKHPRNRYFPIWQSFLSDIYHSIPIWNRYILLWNRCSQSTITLQLLLANSDISWYIPNKNSHPIIHQRNLQRPPWLKIIRASRGPTPQREPARSARGSVPRRPGDKLKRFAVAWPCHMVVSIVMGIHQNRWFIEKIPLKLMIWGYFHFRKRPNIRFKDEQYRGRIFTVDGNLSWDIFWE